MISGDFAVDGVLIDHIIYLVHNNQGRHEIESLAQLFSRQREFADDHEMMNIFHKHFEDITDEVMKKDWAIFCIHVLMKKNYPSILSCEESISAFLTKFEMIPGLARYKEQLKNIKTVKREEFRAKELVILTLQGDWRTAVYCHSWFSNSKCFLEELLVAVKGFPEDSNCIEACILLVTVEPSVISQPLLRKIIRRICQNTSHPLREKLYTLLKGPDPVPISIAMRRSVLPDIQLYFASALEKLFNNQNIDEEISLFAYDLFLYEASLFKDIPLSDFARLAWDKGHGPHLKKIEEFTNRIRQFIIQTVNSHRNILKVRESRMKRAKLIEFFILLARKCFLSQYNINSTFGIIGALLSPEIMHDKTAWKYVSSSLVAKNEQLQTFFSPFSSFKNFRQQLAEYNQKKQPYIPYLAPLQNTLMGIDINSSELGHNINLEKAWLLRGVFSLIFESKENLSYSSEYKTDIIQQLTSDPHGHSPSGTH